jgi:hypothetical protein
MDLLTYRAGTTLVWASPVLVDEDSTVEAEVVVAGAAVV